MTNLITLLKMSKHNYILHFVYDFLLFILSKHNSKWFKADSEANWICKSDASWECLSSTFHFQSKDQFKYQDPHILPVTIATYNTALETTS